MVGIFHISEAAKIALHAMVYLARSKDHMQTGELSRLTGSPKSHVAKVMGLLVKSGMVSSDRGPLGGFQLARPAETISMLEIFESVQGYLDDNSCSMPCPLCASVGCMTGRLAERFNNEFKAYMRNKRLSEFRDNSINY